jgi:hypothetical protein
MLVGLRLVVAGVEVDGVAVDDCRGVGGEDTGYDRIRRLESGCEEGCQKAEDDQAEAGKRDGVHGEKRKGAGRIANREAAKTRVRPQPKSAKSTHFRPSS